MNADNNFFEEIFFEVFEEVVRERALLKALEMKLFIEDNKDQFDCAISNLMSQIIKTWDQSIILRVVALIKRIHIESTMPKRESWRLVQEELQRLQQSLENWSPKKY